MIKTYTVCEGKYGIRYDEATMKVWGVERHGLPWRSPAEFVGDNLFHAMLGRILELEEQLNTSQGRETGKESGV